MSTVSVRRLRAVVLAAACLLPLGAAGEDWELFRRIMGPPLSPVAGLPRAEIETHRIELGRVLYHDKRLSRDDSISCNSCHDTRSFGVDSERLSPGFGGPPYRAQLPHHLQRLHAPRPVLGRPGAHRRGAGQGADPGREGDGDALARCGGRKAGGHPRLLGALRPRLSRERSARHLRQRRNRHRRLRAPLRHPGALRRLPGGGRRGPRRPPEAGDGEVPHPGLRHLPHHHPWWEAPSTRSWA